MCTTTGIDAELVIRSNDKEFVIKVLSPKQQIEFTSPVRKDVDISLLGSRLTAPCLFFVVAGVWFAHIPMEWDDQEMGGRGKAALLMKCG